MITAVFQLINILLVLFWWAVFLSAVVSTLMSFGVLDSRNRIVWSIADFLYRLTEPALRPIRNLLPNLGGIDISPLILLILISVVRTVILPRVYGAVMFGDWHSLIF